LTEPLRPSRGGFVRPFGCGSFIREFLLGYGLNGSPSIDPRVGACQAEIFYYYKTALMRAAAVDQATRTEEKWARREKRSIEPAKIEKLAEQYLSRMPYKSRGCRFHSFIVYFSNLQRLHWVEPTGREEASSFQDHYSPGPPRRYFRLTDAGRTAPEMAWDNPYCTLYG
jgi:hypothetical protein